MTTIVDTRRLSRTDTGGQAGTILEPALGCSGKRIIVTGNWFCSRSTDGGENWTFVDPYKELPPSGAGFCCDQLIHYCSSRRLWIWLLQFSKTTSGNLIRVAVSSSGKPGTWTWWDTTPTDIDDQWGGTWLDYPDLAESEQHLMLSFNVFSTTSDRWQRAVVLRLSLDQLKARKELSREAWSTEEFGSLRFCRGMGSTAIFASLSYVQPSIQVFRWPDDENDVSQVSVAVRPWHDGPYADSDDATSQWMNRMDDRVLGAWESGGVLGFVWAASADSQHPFPFVRVVRIQKSSNELVDEPDLWNSDRAWAYPSVCPNQRGDVGIVAVCGAGGRHPTVGVGWLDESDSNALPVWQMTLGDASTHQPQARAWGDYLDIQPDPRRKTYWVASAFTLQGGGSRTHIVPQVVTFKP